MNETELIKLWTEVSKKFNVGDYDTFKSKMSTKRQRRSFFNKMEEKNYDLGDYYMYESRLSTPQQPITQQQATQVTQQPITQQQATQVTQQPITRQESPKPRKEDSPYFWARPTGNSTSNQSSGTINNNTTPVKSNFQSNSPKLDMYNRAKPVEVSSQTKPVVTNPQTNSSKLDIYNKAKPIETNPITNSNYAKSDTDIFQD